MALTNNKTMKKREHNCFYCNYGNEQKIMSHKLYIEHKKPYCKDKNHCPRCADFIDMIAALNFFYGNKTNRYNNNQHPSMNHYYYTWMIMYQEILHKNFDFSISAKFYGKGIEQWPMNY